MSTKTINLKVDLSSITENTVYGHNVTIDYPMPIKLNFIWYKINGAFPEKLINEKQVYITYEDPDEIAGGGNGNLSEESLKLLKQNGSLKIEQETRSITYRYLPRYNYDHIHEQIICPQCEISNSTEDLDYDYSHDGCEFYMCNDCGSILDIVLIKEEISDDKEFDFIIEKI